MRFNEMAPLFLLKTGHGIPPKGTYLRTAIGKRGFFLDPTLEIAALVMLCGGGIVLIGSMLYLLLLAPIDAEGVLHAANTAEVALTAFVVMGAGLFIRLRDGAGEIRVLASVLHTTPAALVVLTEAELKSCAKNTLCLLTDQIEEMREMFIVGSGIEVDTKSSYRTTCLFLQRYGLAPQRFE